MTTLFTDIGLGVYSLLALVAILLLGLIAQAVADRRRDREAALDTNGAITRHPASRALSTSNQPQEGDHSA